MKVLYVSHANSYPSGWGKAAIDYVLAMDAAGIDVVPRSITLNDKKPHTLPARFLELEAKSAADCDIVIQHVLPHHIKYDGRFKKNIAFCVYESGGTWLNNWNSKINMMDELWVPSKFTERVFVSGGVQVPIKIIPHTFNTEVYSKTFNKVEHPEFAGNYIFYTIADLNIRKNLRALVQAFHLEFTPNEPVKLLIKSSKFGKSPDETFNIIKSECDKIKENMKLYRNVLQYSPELIVTEDLPDSEICKLHKSCHCYVNTSHGEAWCIPLFEAMALGNQCVAPLDMYDYLSPMVSYQFVGHQQQCFGANDTFWEIGSSRENWVDYSVQHIGKAMRLAYEARNRYDKTLGLLKAQSYSYKAIGKQIKDFING